MQRGFVRKRGSTWTAYYGTGPRENRKQHSKGGFKTKRAAQSFLNEVLGSLTTGDYIEPSRLTLGEYLLGQWLPIQKYSIRPSTYHAYENVIALHVVPELGHLVLQDLTPQHLDRLYAALLKSGRKARRHTGEPLSPKSVRIVHTTIHKALRDAERKQLVSRNVAAAADPPRLRQAGQSGMRTWTADELRQFLIGLEGEAHPLYAAFVLAATTGMRRGEVLGLRWSDVDLASKRLAVRQTLTAVNNRLTFGTPKTQRGRRSVALDDFTVGVLGAQLAMQMRERRTLGLAADRHGLAFTASDGGPIHPDQMSQTFEWAIKRHGLPRIRLHDLRHTHATLGFAAGVSPKVMSDRLGHATVSFTLDVYTHAIPAMAAEAAERVAELIFGVSHETVCDTE